jgi:uncharacterized protein YkwD
MSPLVKRSIAYGAIVTLTFAVFFTARQPIVHYASNVITFVKEYSDAHDSMLEALRQEIFSQPLKANIAGDRANLSPSEVIRLSNVERTKVGLPSLDRNSVLDQAATRKLQDMFDRQYFDHISPDGKGPGAVATSVGYSYVIVGENLAMGSFENDQALVDAWMASPGHKENILNNKYTEIGVAVGHGTFNGERIWIAVQEFGKPSSACPAIDSELRSNIEKNKADVAALEEDINKRKTDLETMRHDTPDESAQYNAKVQEYNGVVTRYNTEIANLKKDIDVYNKSVRDFNACANQ